MTKKMPAEGETAELVGGGEIEVDDGFAFLATLPVQDTTITIDRQNAETREWEYCCQGPASGASIEDIRDAFGPGRYRVIARHGTKKNIIGRRTFNIAGGPQAPAGPGWIRRNGETAVQAENAAPSASNTRMERLMDALIAKALQPAPNPLDGMIAAATALSPLLAKLIPERKDPAEIAAKMLEVNKQAGGGGAVETFLRGVEMARSLRSGGGPAPVADDRNSLGAVARDFLPGILEMMAKAQQAPNMAQTPLPNAVEVAALSAGDPAPDGSMPATNVYDAMKGEIPNLVKWAKEGRDPAVVADALLLQVPPYAMSVVEQETHTDIWYTRWFSQYPELAPFRPWVVQVLSAVAESFESESDDDELDAADDAGADS